MSNQRAVNSRKELLADVSRTDLWQDQQTSASWYHQLHGTQNKLISVDSCWVKSEPGTKSQHWSPFNFLPSMQEKEQMATGCYPSTTQIPQITHTWWSLTLCRGNGAIICRLNIKLKCKSILLFAYTINPTKFQAISF